MFLDIPDIIPNDWWSVQTVVNQIRFKLGTDASPTYAGLTLSDLTASQLVQSDANKGLSSVTDLTNWVAGTTNQITVTDDTDGTITLSLPQDIHTGASPTFAGLYITDSIVEELTAKFINTSNAAASFTTLFIQSDDGGGYISGFGSNYTTFPHYTNKILLYGRNTSDGVVINSPNSAGTLSFLVGGHSASDEILNIDINGLNINSGKIIDASAGEVLVEDNDTVEPTNKSDGYIGVAKPGGQPRLYFTVDGIMYYVEGSAGVVPVTGNPIGLLLCLTYNLD